MLVGRLLREAVVSGWDASGGAVSQSRACWHCMASGAVCRVGSRWQPSGSQPFPGSDPWCQPGHESQTGPQLHC